MARKPKYHQLSRQEQLQFHFARYIYNYAIGDYFEAYRQSCIAASVANDIKNFNNWIAKRRLEKLPS